MYLRNSLGIVSWVSMATLVVAYAGLSFNFWTAQNILYQGVNLIGSLLIAINAHLHRDEPASVLNYVWAGIAGIAILRIIFIR